MKSLNEMRPWGDPYHGIRLEALSPEQATHLLEAVEILHDWILEYLAEDRRTESLDDDEIDEDF
jgi:hypothetical protein